jgi:hypothetical protein
MTNHTISVPVVEGDAGPPDGPFSEAGEPIDG